MAIIGGAGNPVGGSFTGPAEALEIIGDHAYAMSGSVTINNNTVTQFSFTSGNFYLDGKYEFQMDATNMAPTKVVGYIIKFNGVVVCKCIIETVASQVGMDLDRPTYLIIPPYTEVVIEATTNRATDMETFGIITGRIYRTRD